MRHIAAALAIGLMAIMAATAAPAGQGTSGAPVVFATWDDFEVDKCAVVWLIRKHVDPKAEIKFFPKGTPITEGIAFDTPDAALRRFHNRSTFEVMMRHYGLKGGCLDRLRDLIHDIEINIWDRKRFEESARLQQDIDRLITESQNAEEITNKCIRFFEGLCGSMTDENTNK
jgi:hypothetical protein